MLFYFIAVLRPDNLYDTALWYFHCWLFLLTVIHLLQEMNMKV